MDFIKEERSEMRKRGTSVEEKKLRAEEKGREFVFHLRKSKS